MLDSCRALEQDGLEVTYLPVRNDGLIDMQELKVRTFPRLLTTPSGSQRLPTAPYDYKHTLLSASNDSH